MRLLYDQNLPRRLVQSLHDLFPGSEHVLTIGLDQADDHEIWEYAIERGMVIASKDADFQERALLRGPPPKVIWLDCGNCSAAHVEDLLRRNHRTIVELVADEQLSVVVIR